MAERKKKEETAARPTKDEREATKELVKERMKEAKIAGTSFKDFYADLALEMPDVGSQSAVYSWWTSVQTGIPKPEKTTTTAGKDNPSDKLSALLRKEGLLLERVKQAQSDLLAVREEVESLWQERQKVTEAATK